jgi:hypothetical protein
MIYKLLLIVFENDIKSIIGASAECCLSSNLWFIYFSKSVTRLLQMMRVMLPSKRDVQLAMALNVMSLKLTVNLEKIGGTTAVI